MNLSRGRAPVKAQRRDPDGLAVRQLAACLLFSFSIFSIMTAFMYDVLYAFSSAAILIVIAMYIISGNSTFLPKTAPEFYFSLVLVLLPLAPALGGGGTIVRFVLAGYGVILLALSPNGMAAKLPKTVATALVLLVSYFVFLALLAPSIPYGVTRGLNWVMFIPAALLVFRHPKVNALVFGLLASCALQAGGVYFQLEGRYGGTWGGLLVNGRASVTPTVERITRYTGFVLNPNNLGLLFALTAIVTLIFILKSPVVLTRIFSLLAFSFLLYGVVLTNSRTAIISFALGSLSALLILGLNRLVAMVVIASTVGYIAYQSGWTQVTRFVDSFGDIANETDTSYLARLSLWGERIADLDALEWIGGGGFGATNRTSFANQQGFSLDDKAQIAATVDNSWLKIWIEGGIVSVVLLLLVVLLSLTSVIRARVIAGNRTTAAAICGVSIAFFWASLSYDNLDINPWNGFLWLILGISISQRRLIGRLASSHKSRAANASVGGRQEPTYVADRDLIVYTK